MPIRDQLRVFSRTELLSRAELEALELRRLRSLLARTWARNGSYQGHWRAAGVGPRRHPDPRGLPRAHPVRPEAGLSGRPGRTSPLGRRLGVPAELVRHVHMTSGSSGIDHEAWGLTPNGGPEVRRWKDSRKDRSWV